MTTVGAERMLIESAVPTFDAMITEHLVVAADPPTTFRAARALDLLTVRTPLEWRDVALAANFSVAPYGENTLLSYQCRTTTTDPGVRRSFLRHWWLIRPFAAHIMRATLNAIKADAEAAAIDRSG